MTRPARITPTCSTLSATLKLKKFSAVASFAYSKAEHEQTDVADHQQPAVGPRPAQRVGEQETGHASDQVPDVVGTG